MVWRILHYVIPEEQSHGLEEVSLPNFRKTFMMAYPLYLVLEKCQYLILEQSLQ
jgi:hypothetical protein